MGRETDIQWCDSTVNPVMGCAGCELWTAHHRSCYAGVLHRMRRNHSGFARDFEVPEMFPARMNEAAAWGVPTARSRADKPWLLGMPRLIFVSDMGDALSESIPFAYLFENVIAAVRSPKGQRHCWLWLTKRPQRMAAFSAWLLAERGVPWPANVWAGTSLTTAASLTRLEQLKQVGNEQTLRFLSNEPQWEELDLTEPLLQGGIHWVIQGGESGPLAKPFHLEWAWQLMHACRLAGIPYFLKQLGCNAYLNGERIALRDAHGGDWDEWPEVLRVREFPQPRS